MKKDAQYDFLKYWRVIRYFYKAKYNLGQGDMDMLLFLYSEKYFTKETYDKFNQVLIWDKNRFNRLKAKGWIVLFRKGGGKIKSLYDLSYKSKRMILEMYKKLNGEELMPTSPCYNPIFREKVPYSHIVYRNMIKEMNEATKQLLHQPPEL